MVDPETPSNTSSARIWLVAILTVVAVQGAFTTFRFPEVSEGALIDTDSYMHLVRARELLSGEPFFNPVIERSNVPFGETQHWTRPFDLLLVAIATPFAPLAGIDTALFAAALLVGPIVLAGIMVSFSWSVRPIISPGNRQLSLLVVASQLAVLAYSAVGRADHHGTLVLLLTLCVGLLMRLMMALRTSRHEAFLGLAMAIGLWVSTEFLAVIGIAVLSLGIAWIARGPALAMVGARVSFWLLGGTVVAVLLERGPRWSEVEYDRISLVHVALAAVLSAIYLGVSLIPPNRSRIWRLASGLVASTIGLISLTALFPDVLGGPWAPIDPTIRRIWLDHVAELQPLLPGSGGDLSLALIYLGPPFFGLILLIAGLLRRKIAALWWVPVLVGAPLFLLLALRYARFAPHAEMFGAVPLMWGLDRGLQRADTLKSLPRLIVRLGLSISTFLGFLIIGALVPTSQPDSDESFLGGCDLQALATFLNDPQSFENRPRTILANIDFGSELLYRTSDRVISTPIRQQDAILDTYVALTTAELSTSKRIITDREVDLVLLCPSHDKYLFGDPPPEGSLNQILLDDRPPPWLVQVTLPKELSSFRVFVTRP